MNKFYPTFLTKEMETWLDEQHAPADEQHAPAVITTAQMVVEFIKV